MTNDYISRKATLDALGVTKNATKYGGDHSGYDTRMLYEIHDALTGIPAADVAPVVHGRWIRGKYTDDDLRYNDYSYRCNRCGKIVDFEENYCPNCGAKMDVQGEE